MKFITVEGIEGVGKSTAVEFIHSYLIKKKQHVVLTREPGGTRLAEKIRHILLTLSLEEQMKPITECLLMFASRAQHLAHIIQPALQKKKWVICDRFIDATYAYQGYGRGLDLLQIKTLDRWVVNNLYPDMTILLDAPPQIGLARAKHRGPHDRIEKEKIDFFERVREGYLERVKEDKKRFYVVDATKPLSDVNIELQKILDKLIKE